MKLEDTEISSSGEGSPVRITAADPRDVSETEAEVDDLSNDFEFAFAVKDLTDSTSDDVFTPVYPVFGRRILLDDDKAIGVPLRRLMIEDREACQRSGSASSTSSSTDDIEGVVSAGNYCAWTPRSVPASPDRRKKSSSTGSRSRRWSLKDLVVGRSHSDGKDKLAILAAAAENQEAGKSKGAAVGKEVTKGKGRKVTEMDMATAHRLFYSKGIGAGTAASGGGGGQRSFLPYKQDLVGFLGLSRSHPF